VSQETVQTGAEKIQWNLADLYPNLEALEADLQWAGTAAETFQERYRGRVGSLEADALALALKEFEDLHERLGRAHSYAYLNWSTSMDNSENGALLQKVREASAKVDQEILFFELEWTHLEDEKAEKLLQKPELAAHRHYLELQRVRRPHVLQEAEERILSEKSLTGRQAWNRLFDELLGNLKFSFNGDQVTEQEILAKLYSPGREERKAAAAALTEGLQPHLPTLTFIFNTVLADKNSDDHLRAFPHWLSSRNLANETSPETVQVLIDSVTSRYDLVARYYRLKKRLLNLSEMYDYDRYAPLGDSEAVFPWEKSRDLVLEAYSAFHPLMGSIAGDFFELGWIDAPVRAGKKGGAFSHSTVPTAHPYVFMNYTGTVRDVQTLAHELGHGVHQYLSRKQGVLQSGTPLTLAEAASTFGEMLVFDRLLNNGEMDSQQTLALLLNKIDDITATIFRQVAMNRFEDHIHTARRTQGELSSEQLSQFWMQTQEQMFQGSVSFTEQYRIWWSYIPHFLHTPGYVYAYAFGELLVLALYNRYSKQGPDFAEGYLELLEAGGSDWPHVLVGKLDINLNDPDFWKEGLLAVEKMIVKAENLANGEPDNPSPAQDVPPTKA